MPYASYASCSLSVFLFNDTATTEIYTLSLHDALPISARGHDVDDAEGVLKTLGDVDDEEEEQRRGEQRQLDVAHAPKRPDRKSTRLNSSHSSISYAVFCLKKKKNKETA